MESQAISLIHSTIRQCNSLKAALKAASSFLLNDVGSGMMLRFERVRLTKLIQSCACTFNKQTTVYTYIQRYSFNTPVSLHRYFPFGIVFLVAGKILDMHDPAVLAEKLGMYFITVLAGLFVHGVILLPMFFFIFTRKNPFNYIRGLLQALVIALATSSR